MRKYIIYAVLFLCILSHTNGQDDTRRIVDSTKKELNSAKGDKRIDCLNLLAGCYFDLWDDDDKQLDTACSYAGEAYSLAKNSNYKRGLGYALLMKASCSGGRVDNNKKNNNSEINYTECYNYANKAIQIGEDIKDYRLVGDVYDELKWLERWKGDSSKFKYNVEKAIYYYEKPVTNSLVGLLNVSKCDQCQGNEGQLAWLYQLLATIIAGEKNIDAAKDQINKSAHYYEMTGNKNSIGGLYANLSRAYFLKHDYKSSIEASIKSISYYKETNDKENQIRVMTELCKVFEIPGDFENGIEYGKKSIQLAEELFKNKPADAQNSIAWGQAFFWMCRLYQIAGDYGTALDIIRRGHNYYPNPIDSVSNAFWKAQIGDIHRLLGNYDSALYYLEPFASTVNDRNNFGKTSLGYLYLDLKEYDKALEITTPFLQYLRNLNRVMPPTANSLIISASAYFGKKDYNTALQYARECQADLKIMDGRVIMIKNYKLLSDIFLKVGKTDSAYFYLDKYTALKDSLINRQFYWKLNGYKKEAEEEKKTSQINMLNKDNQIKEQKLKQQAFVKNGLIIGLVLIVLLGVFIFRTLTLKKKNELQKQKLESEKRQAELQQKASELEMQALRAQMNPHFIFNCLSSINKFILKNDTDAASDYLTRFSRLIRQSLTNSQLSLIPLNDEIEMLRLYLDMERLRFSDSFTYNITYENSIEPETVYVPPMLLQPFCENAIWHGLMHKEGAGKLEIVLSLENGQLRCIIADNGVGRTRAAELKSKSNGKQKSLGLKITTERLALFNDQGSTQDFYRTEDIFDSNGEIAGTKVVLNIKIKKPTHQPAKETV